MSDEPRPDATKATEAIEEQAAQQRALAAWQRVVQGAPMLDLVILQYTLRREVEDRPYLDAVLEELRRRAKGEAPS